MWQQHKPFICCSVTITGSATYELLLPSFDFDCAVLWCCRVPGSAEQYLADAVLVWQYGLFVVLLCIALDMGLHACCSTAGVATAAAACREAAQVLPTAARRRWVKVMCVCCMAIQADGTLDGQQQSKVEAH